MGNCGRLIRANLHLHSHASKGDWGPLLDHNLSPELPHLLADAENYGLDFIAVTDHAEAMTQQEWDDAEHVLSAPPGELVAIRSFEWTLQDDRGADHINVFGTTDKANANEKGDGAGCGQLKPCLSDFYTWLTTATSAYAGAPVVAQLNHLAINGSHFDDFSPPSPQIAVIVTLAELSITRPLTPPQEAKVEMLSLTPFPFNIRRGEAQWQKALAGGWRVAPTLNADNDGLLEPSARRFHTGVFLKPGRELAAAAVLEALAERRVFASQDVDAEIQLWHGDSFMGGIDVPVEDGSTFRLLYRDPETSTRRLQIEWEDSAIVIQGEELPLEEPRREGRYWVWDIEAPTSLSEYYIYARIRQSPTAGQFSGGDYIFSAPMWCKTARD